MSLLKTNAFYSKEGFTKVKYGSLIKMEQNYLKEGHHNVISERLNNRGQIDLIDMELASSENFKYLFTYEDLSSGFVILKALSNNTAAEVANELFNILTIIGPPQVLQSKNGREFVRQVIRHLYLLWDGFHILYGGASKNMTVERNFKAKLKSWVSQNPSRTWVDGIKNIQIMENTTHIQSNGKVPYECLFGHSWQKMVKNLSTVNENVRDIWSEEEWLSRHNSVLLNGQIPDECITNVDEDSARNSLFSSGKNEVKQSINLSDDNNDAEDYVFISVKNEGVESILKPEESNETEEFEKSDLKCKICQKEYIKLGHLKNHMKTHLTRDRYDCEVCSKTFRIKSLYEKHIFRFHSQSESSEANNELNPEMENSVIEQRLQSSEIIPKSKRRGAPKSRENHSLECTYCKQKFDFPSVLKRHVRSHTNERPYVCQVCSKSFKQLGHLSQHAVTHTNYRSLQCSFCNVKFESLETLKAHSQSHRGDSNGQRPRETYRLFECDNCKKVFTTKSVLERHIFTHTHERQFGCKVCGKRFKQAGHVKSHMLVHTGERKFQCSVCSKRFSLSNSLKKHMYVHNGEKPYQCDICGARFLEKRNLNGHVMTHTNERPYSCKICGKRYTLADTLKRHISAAHEHGRTYQCEICAKMFKQLAHLSVHKKVHNDERPFQCHLCEKNFKHKNVLKSHLAIHANVRPFECDECKATFVRKTNLQTHITSAHMNERPYVCTICNKRFKQVSHLNGHVVVHSNSMPYQCDFCDRRCNRLDNLKKHMRLHTKNKTAFQG